MKKALLLSFALFSFGYIFGQLQVSPIQFDTCVGVNNPDLSLDSHVKNLGGSSIDVVWSRTIVSMPDAWDNYVCTGLLCYGPDTEKGSFILGAGGTTELLTHFNVNGTEGSSVVTITLTEKNNPTNSVTVTYNICAQTTATNNVINANSIVLYPNPTVDYFMIKNKSNVAKVNISNIAGRQLKTYNTPRDRYDVGDLNGGIYIVQLLDSKSKVIKTSRLSIQRP